MIEKRADKSAVESNDLTLSRTGVVAIGRNEGERLRKCLNSIPQGIGGCVYVDSGSTDGSQALASSFGFDVMELDMNIPFTAARARNAGIERLRQLHPNITSVHVLDGDCVFEPGWIERSLDEMRNSDDIAVVCGRRREKYPTATIYNQLCDLDWEANPGDARSCGGDALIRLEAFDQVDGYNPRLIAGEEPEMCFRMRQNGWRIRQLSDTMTWHDAAMTRHGQWWRRCVRAGYAAVEGAWMHGRSPEKYNVRRVISILIWTMFVPVVSFAAVIFLGWWGLAVVSLYPLQIARLWLREVRHRSAGIALLHAWHLVIDKFAQLQGMLTFLYRRLMKRQATLIEYKGAASSAAGAVSQ